MTRRPEYSQVFLRSPQLVAELIGHSNIRANDTVWDIGAGSGVITSVLARRCKHVVAIEPEPAALAKLRTNLSGVKNVQIIAGDFLSTPLPTTPYKVFANIPFHLSSPIVKRLTSQPKPARSIYLIVQRQFARKIVPSDHHFTALLGTQIAPWFTARIRKPLRRTDYTPPPSVDTCLLELKPREIPLLDFEQMYDFQDFVAKCYADPRLFIATARSRAGIPPGRKPSEVTPEQWVALYELS